MKGLYESGRVEDFLECEEAVLDFRQRIFNFPAEYIKGLLCRISSQQAQDLLRRLNSERESHPSAGFRPPHINT